MGGNTSAILKVACMLGSSSGLRSAFKQKCCGHFLYLLSCTKCAQKFTLTWQIKELPPLLQKWPHPCGSNYACAFNSEDHCLQSKLLWHLVPPHKLENTGLLHAENWKWLEECITIIYRERAEVSSIVWGFCSQSSSANTELKIDTV